MEFTSRTDFEFKPALIDRKPPGNNQLKIECYSIRSNSGKRCRCIASHRTVAHLDFVAKLLAA
jgi:hypothetical protein